MLAFNVLLLAKNHNFFGIVDSYMKEFSRLVLDTMPSHISQRLENVLSKEIFIAGEKFGKESVIEREVQFSSAKDGKVHHNFLAQPEFLFRPRP